MDCITASDDHFAPHVGALMHSLWVHMPECRLAVLDHGIGGRNRERLLRLADALGVTLQIVAYDLDRLHSVPVADRITPAAYARLLIPELLPEAVNRVLYLDADTIVVDDLRPLLQMDLAGQPIAACPEAVPQTGPRMRELGVRTEDYFNSGVMVLDLARWRAEGIGRQAIERAKAQPQQMLFWDQCALNAVLAGRVRFLQRAWNFQTKSLLDYHPGEPVHVVHFTGPIKPWGPVSAHPLRDLYWLHRRQTPWANDWRPYVSRSTIRSCMERLKLYLPRKRTAQRRQARTLALRHLVRPYTAQPRRAA